MKKSLLLIPIAIALAIFFYPTISNSKVDGSPGSKTNSPMDGQNCTGCHSGTINSGIGNIEITTNIPTSGYSTGSTYTITLTGIQASCTKFGFELTAENAMLGKAGTFLITNSTETKFADGTNNTAVTHKTAGNSGNTTKSWSMDWTASTNISGSTIFYAALLFANNNGNWNGDNTFTTSLTVNEDVVNVILDKTTQVTGSVPLRGTRPVTLDRQRDSGDLCADSSETLKASPSLCVTSLWQLHSSVTSHTPQSG